ncbi:MAG: hypothetical protein WBF17_21925 [Phycisphaerae bacterium]
MSKYRVPRTGRPMLTFFGDLIAKKESGSSGEDGRHEFSVKLFRTEAPGYVLAVHYRDGSIEHDWAAHTPTRLEVAGLFGRYITENALDPAAAGILQEATQAVMLQAPELDEMVQWSSVVANNQ